MAMAAFEWERGEATPEMLDFYRRHVGLEYECEGWISEASRDAIRHFAEGVGDDNPLYLDPSYAGASPYGGLIAPPTFPDVFSNKGFTAEDGFHRGPLPGLFGLWAADRWEFHQPVRLGDTLRSIFRMDSIRERPSAFGGTAYEQVDRNTYYNQAGELVASYVILRFNYEREAARGRDKYGGCSRTGTPTPRSRRSSAATKRSASAAAGPNRSIGRTSRRAPPSRPSSRGRSR